MARVSDIVPHLCGVPSRKRYIRWLTMSKCFVDDSGNHDSDPYLILAGWSGMVRTWDSFIDDWAEELEKPKRIDYYKHHEAASLSGCFENFTTQEATQKTIDMSMVIATYHIYPFVVTVPRSQFKTSVVSQVIKVRQGKINRRVKSLFPAAFGSFVPFVLQKHYELGVREKIDFTVDSDGKSDKVLLDAMKVWREIKAAIKANPSNPFNQLAGEVVPGDDKEILPLQAADLLAGQVRSEIINQSTPIGLNLWKARGKQIWRYDVSEKDMEEFRGHLNVAIATDRLEKIRRQIAKNETQTERVSKVRQSNARTVSRSAKRTSAKTRRRKAR
jgi:hypothetical protein